jgi:hypothetical protein
MPTVSGPRLRSDTVTNGGCYVFALGMGTEVSVSTSLEALLIIYLISVGELSNY